MQEVHGEHLGPLKVELGGVGRNTGDEPERWTGPDEEEEECECHAKECSIEGHPFYYKAH